MDVGALSDLLGVVLWPLVVLTLVLLFRYELSDLLSRDQVALNVPGGVRVVANRSEAAAQALVDAAKDKDQPLDPKWLGPAVKTTSAEVKRLGRPARVLWVDDRPKNNEPEKKALEALDMTVRLSGTTRDALRAIRRLGPYDVVISDMARPPFRRAGYRLIRAMRRRRVMTPVVIYASLASDELFNDAVRHGAAGSANLLSDLVDLVTDALRAQVLTTGVRPPHVPRRRSGIPRGARPPDARRGRRP